MTKFIESLLKERKKHKFQLAEYMKIGSPALSYKLKKDSWTVTDFIKVVAFFSLTDEEILVYMNEARKEQKNERQNN